jgi:hypothetical protein
MTLYDAYLPLVQSLNDYGGNFASIHIRRPVLEAIDNGAQNDPALRYVQDKLHEKMQQWTGLQDHESFSEFFEAYYEGVFYLAALHRGVSLRNIPAGKNKGNTPDFETIHKPPVNFEIKTIDLSNPERTYNKIMAEGLDAKLEAETTAKRTGHGTAVRTIAPHGAAKNFLEVVEQVMKKIDSNIKAGQYSNAPTILVVSTARSTIHDRAENLRKWLPWPGLEQPASGQLFAIAAHEVDQPFFFPSDPWSMDNLGPLRRAGISRDHGFIAGLIFLATEMSASNSCQPVEGVYSFNGIWNADWEKSNPFGRQATVCAKKVFENLCDAWNDTEDSRSNPRPTLWRVRVRRTGLYSLRSPSPEDPASGMTGLGLWSRSLAQEIRNPKIVRPVLVTVCYRLAHSQSAYALTEDEDFMLHPEHLVTGTMPFAEARAWQDRLRAIDEFHPCVKSLGTA